MTLSPAFLDDIRTRVPLVQVIQRRTRLVKKGHEYSGLCPFHNEKSPSFTVNEDKGFYHCFGCGEHGDVITFVMKTQNMGFPEAVESLAAEAGLEVPKATPRERERAVRQQTLNEAMDAACGFYEAQLQSHAGAAARAYLEGRGLDAAAIARFRLGYAPSMTGGEGLLKQSLSRDFPPALLVEAGLLKAPEDGRPAFDYFRDRVMFPILDRGGKVIAFGGRVMGDAKPKYLNSPDTPIFHKGRVLYGLSWARQGVAKGAEVIVTEGYMDVIALHRAGFTGAVAPLGTALTEEQIGELWRLAEEPILCFDGDSAGQRAASRALDRAMPLLKPGKSLRFAPLPTGEDPDTLLSRFGVDAMRSVLTAARPLAEVLWARELAERPVDTPERKADLGRRLAEQAGRIADEGLKREYQGFFRNCLYERLRPARVWGRQGAARPGRGGRGQPAIPVPDLPPPDPTSRLARRSQEVLVCVLAQHPELLDEVIEDFAEIHFTAVDLDKLRREIINVHARNPGLDAATLKHHLITLGFAGDLETVMSPQVLEHAKFARSADRETQAAGWRQALGFWRDHLVGMQEMNTAVDRAVEDPQGVVGHMQAVLAEKDQRRNEETELDGPARGR